MLTLSFGEKQFHWYLSYYCSSQAKDAESCKGRAKYENLKASDILEDMRNFCFLFQSAISSLVNALFFSIDFSLSRILVSLVSSSNLSQ